MTTAEDHGNRPIGRQLIQDLAQLSQMDVDRALDKAFFSCAFFLPSVQFYLAGSLQTERTAI